eukprot:scaffold5297_cov104-Cylindrotheca_fusiformis.AAC.4
MVLAILPIPSAILSIFGSSVILYMALKSREERKWTPYTRLLIGLSIFDIFSSANMAVSTFLRPSDSHRIWSFGNDTTCSVIGFLTQATHSSACYNAMLSFYFLLTARFGLKNSYIATWIEPLMHFISIGYFFGTAIVGAALGVYADLYVGTGCWVNDYPRNCGHGPGQTGEDCLGEKIGWIFYGYPVGPSLPKKNVSNTSRSINIASGDQESDEFGGCQVRGTLQGDVNEPLDFRNSQSCSNPSTFKQLRRLKMVETQAFLFVANYLMVSIWLGLMAILQKRGSRSEAVELSAETRLYPIMVLNAIFMPLQGFLNLLVYMRPKYLKWRDEYPLETRMWVVRRCILGEKVRPTKVPGRNGIVKEESDQDIEAPPAAAAARLPISMVSTLTLSVGDFDHSIPGKEERWAGSERTEKTVPWIPSRRSTSRGLHHRISSLEVICETSASVFESVTQDGYDLTERDAPRRALRGDLQTKKLEDFEAPADRWSPFPGSVDANQDIVLVAPRLITDSEVEEVRLSEGESSRTTFVGSSNHISDSLLISDEKASKKRCRWALIKDHTTPRELTMPQRLASEADDTEISIKSASSMNSVGSLREASKKRCRWVLTKELKTPRELTMPQRLASEADDTEISIESASSMNSVGSLREGSFLAPDRSSCESRWNCHPSRSRQEFQRHLEMPHRAESITEPQHRESSLWTCMFGTSDEPIQAPRRILSPSTPTARRPVLRVRVQDVPEI